MAEEKKWYLGALELGEDLYNRLKKSAETDRRSMVQQAIYLLDKATSNVKKEN